MIKSFRHKGLESFFQTGTKKGINPAHAWKLCFILDRLETSVNPGDMNLPLFSCHELQGDRKGTFAVSVNGNWRVTFRFEGENAVDVNLEDYH